MVDYSSLSVYGKVTYIFQYICIVIAVFGIAGNLLTFIVLSQNKFKKHSFAFYLRVMNVFDNVVLLTSFRHWAAFVLDADTTLVFDVFCRLGEYSVYVAASVSVWNLFLITADRFATIVFPNKFPIFKKTHFQAFLYSITIIYSICIYIPMVVYYNLLTSASSFNNQTNATIITKSCVIVENHDLLVYWTNLVNLMVITFFLNNILTLIIIVSIFRSRKKFVASGKNSSVAVKDRKFAINSIALNVTCFLCKTPMLISLIISSYLTLDGEQIGMLFTIGVCIYTVDNSSAFFVNFFVNSIFYQEVLNFFGFGTYLLQGSQTRASRSMSTKT